MEAHIEEMDVGDTDAIEGKMEGFNYNIWGMKEPNYVMRMMATGGALFTEGCKSVARVWDNGTAKQFHYTQPYDWHFHYRHLVDDHNNKRHAIPFCEDSWNTDHWTFCVFTFLFAVTEVNVFLVHKFWTYRTDPSNLPVYVAFRRQLAWQFIDNPHLVSELKEANDSNVFKKDSPF
mmetsp:Transcript_5756/g.11762  ORF Transcript_5756/g.11762 Transcript_5756/m.11762 type:complete len:176 (+) Transcript_5756:290-817(+)